MLKNQQFLADIKALLKKYKSVHKGKGLLFPSENDQPIKAIDFYYLWKYIWGWQEESNEVSKQRLAHFASVYDDIKPEDYTGLGMFKPGRGERELAKLILSQDNIVSFKRKQVFNSSAYDLYIVVYFNKKYVGIKTTLIES